jgi:hypothetical protein
MRVKSAFVVGPAFEMLSELRVLNKVRTFVSYTVAKENLGDKADLLGVRCLLLGRLG